MMVPELLRVVPLKLRVRSATQVGGDTPMYEVFCRWRNETLKADDSFTYTEWNVWKSYEAFQALDAQLRAQKHCRFAKMMVTVAFAPEHRVRAFFHQDQTARFLEKRQKELDYYMQRILLFSGVAEFTAGTGSRVLAEFLQADAHIDCARLMATSPTPAPALSPTAELLEQHSREALRTLNVDMHAAFSPSSHSYASSTTSSFDKLGASAAAGVSVRKVAKQEIEDELVLRFGEHQLKRFRKRARAFRQENDPAIAAQAFVAFVAAEYDAEFAPWVLQRFVKTNKSEEKKAALRAAAGDALLGCERGTDGDGDAAARKARRASLKILKRTSSTLSSSSAGNPAASASASLARLSRKQSSKEIMARVAKFARGNDEHVEAFKVAAKALGSQEMTAAQFAAFVRATFGRDNSRELLLLVVDVVPLPHVQRELREMLAI